MFTVDIKSSVLCSFCDEFLGRYWFQESSEWPKGKQKLTIREINRKYFGSKYYNSMRRRLFGEVDVMGRSSGGRGKKREVKGRGKGRSKIAVSAARGRGRGRGRDRGRRSGQGKLSHYFIFL